MNPTTNARGGINRTSRREEQGLVATGTTGTGSAIQTVSANELANPPARVQPPIPEVAVPNTRTGAIIDNVATNNEGFITAQTEEAARARELANLLGTQTFDAAGQRQALNEQFGQPQNLARLTDIQTQLTKRNEQTRLAQAEATAGGAGAVQAQRAITLADKQAAIRDAGLAAEAAVLQGNIQTASTLINEAMSDYYQDRQLNNQNMINQLNYFQGIADEQTSQLLAKEQRKYEEDQRQVIRAETAVDAAITSGYASPEDLKKITSLAGEPQLQTAYAQTVVANAARQAAAMERQKLAISQANLAVSQSTADLNRRAKLFELAAMGDPEAITELGYDPTVPLKEAEVKKIDNKISEVEKAEQTITDLLSNKIGLQSSSGEWQFGEATIKGFTGSEPTPADALPLSVGVGTQLATGFSGVAKARQAKSTFLAKADQLLTKEGLLEIGDLAAQDIKLTPITERELGILFQSASVLNAAARRDDSGKLTGFSIPDTEVEKEFQQMLLSYTNVKAELAAEKNLGSGVFGELETLRQEVQQ